MRLDGYQFLLNSYLFDFWRRWLRLNAIAQAHEDMKNIDLRKRIDVTFEKVTIYGCT